MKLKQKIGIISVIFTAFVLIVESVIIGVISSQSAKSIFEESERLKLISLRNTKQQEIENYFRFINQQLLNKAQSNDTIDALKRFSQSAKSYSYQSGYALREAEVNRELSQFYNGVFGKKYSEMNSYKTQSKQTDFTRYADAMSQNAKALQLDYIVKNAEPTGQKDGLLTTGNGSSYDRWHSYYHPSFSDFQKRFGFYDVFLVDIDTGMISYSVFKEVDFGTSLIDGPYSNSGIAEAFTKAKALAKGEVALTDFKPYYPSYEQSAGFMATPVFDGEKKIGVLIFQAPLDEINRIMTFQGDWSEAGLGSSGEVYLIGSDKRFRSEGRNMIEDKAGYLSKLAKTNMVSEQIIDHMDASNSVVGLKEVNTEGVKLAQAGQTGYQIFDNYYGESVLSAFAPLNIMGLDWIILAEIYESEAFASVNSYLSELKSNAIIILVVLLPITALVSIIGGNMIAKPIVEMSQFITKMAKNLDLSTRLESKRKDEIGDAAAALNKLLNQLQSAMQDVAEASNDIGSTIGQMLEVTKDTFSITEAQRTKADQVSESMTEMLSTIDGVTQFTGNNTQASSQVTQRVNDGSAVMKETVSIIEKLAELTHENTATMNELENHSQTISQVVNVINDIAEQTNLLALNAAIEAARAGEQGRGFAVVADEVRGLASRTQASTSEISDMVVKLQRGARQAVNSIAKSSEQVSNSVSQVTSTQEMLEMVLREIEQIGMTSTSIENVAKTQGQTTKIVSANVNNFYELSEQAVQGAKKVENASNNLAKATSNLDSLVSKFTL